MQSSTEMIIVTTMISLLSLIVSAVTLFLAQLRAPKLTSIVGPEIQIYYPRDGGFGVYIPVSFVNESPKTGVVKRCGVSVFRKSSQEDERYFMEWRFFVDLNPDLSFTLKEAAHALAVPGKSSIAKTLWLTWRAASSPELIIAEGAYALVFHYWHASDDKPRNDMHEFYVDHFTWQELEKYRTSKNSTVVNLLLDKKIGANKLLTSYESRSLLGA
jgi:hypothetical protein